LLEVGCGTGQLTGWLADQISPGSVVAVDFSQKMLELARTKSDKAEFRLMDVCRDALEPNRFDVAFCFHCFPHFRDQASAMHNLAGSLKPGGRMLVVHLNSRQGINDFHDEIGGAVAGHHLPDDEQWDTLLSDAGMEKTMLADGEGLFLLEAKRVACE
ncbi:MAG: class I SAM-dependent methyltransferase, partial [Planctomycetota bacterium]|nr:class I SAM-dependent methyltransferase [Planctomycetota bacterium]